MKKTMFVLALTISVSMLGTINTSRVLAQGPMTPQQIVDAFLAKGGKEISRKIESRGVPPMDMCQVIVTFFNVFVPTKTQSGVYGTQRAAEEIGLKELEFIDLTNASVLNDGRNFSITMYFDKSFCNPPPPSGDAKAQNPVLDRGPHPSHDDPANFMNWAIAGLVVLGTLFLFFPPFRRVFVRI